MKQFYKTTIKQYKYLQNNLVQLNQLYNIIRLSSTFICVFAHIIILLELLILYRFFVSFATGRKSQEKSMKFKNYQAIYDKSSCYPYITNKDMGKNQSITGEPLNPNDTAMPCGLIAHDFQNDTFELIDQSNNYYYISQSDITWSQDLDYFQNIDINKQWLNFTDGKIQIIIKFKKERFINWMRLGLSNQIVKLWGLIDTQLKKGNYTLNIKQYNLNKTPFNQNQKSVILQSQGLFISGTIMKNILYFSAGINFLGAALIKIISLKKKIKRKYDL